MKYNATIMVPAFNAEKFLPESLSSALNQTYSGDYEILIVNDGSTDSTGKIAEDFAKVNSHIRVLHQKNQGISAARNRLLEESRGEILLGLDADDRLHPNALEKIVNFCCKNPSIGFVYTNSHCINEKGNLIYSGGSREECHQYFDALIYHANFAGHLRSFRKSLIKNARFNEEIMTGGDWDFILQITPFVKKEHIPEFLYDYRINNSGISKVTNKKNKQKNTKDLLMRRILENKLYPHAKNIKIVRIAEGDHAIYYEHFVDGLPMMNPKSKEALIKYFSFYKTQIKLGN